MEHRIITISRQFGSGGRTIGKEVASKLGIPCYDQELIEMFAKESGFSEEYIKASSEQTKHKSILSSILADRTYDTHITEDFLWEAQKKVIMEVAKKGPCVIIGRCAGSILENDFNCLSVYIHADKTARAERIVKVYGEREDSPEKRIADKDRSRKAYYQKYTKKIWGNAEDFDICLDSNALGSDTCIKIITELY